MLETAREEVDLDALLRDWSLTKDDLREIHRARGEGRLWTALHVCSLRRTGRFADEPERVPHEAIVHLARQIGVHPPARLAILPRQATDSAIRNRVREYLGFVPFSADAEARQVSAATGRRLPARWGTSRAPRAIPAVVGSYTNINATLTLQSSTVRVSSELANGVYARTGQDDARFVDYFGSTDMIVTSSGSNDSGMFETNLREDRFLPFEGAGAFGVFNLSLASQIRAFDYSTISDVILHIRHTARPAGNPLGSQATKELTQMLDAASQPPLALMFCLRYDFPTEWSAFINGTAPFQVVLQKYYFPYMVQSARKLSVDGLKLYSANGSQITATTPLAASDIANITAGLQSKAASATVTLSTDPNVLTRTQEEQVYLVLQYHFGKQ